MTKKILSVLVMATMVMSGAMAEETSEPQGCLENKTFTYPYKKTVNSKEIQRVECCMKQEDKGFPFAYQIGFRTGGYKDEPDRPDQRTVRLDTEVCKPFVEQKLGEIKLPTDGKGWVFVIGSASNLTNDAKGYSKNARYSQERANIVANILKFNPSLQGKISVISATDWNGGEKTGDNDDWEDRATKIILATTIEKFTEVAGGITNEKLREELANKAKAVWGDAVDMINAVAGLTQMIDENKNVWRDKDGKFNKARLASDSIGAVVLGTTSALITSHVMKKKQVENGFEDIHCTIGGQKVADWSDEFRIGVR